MEYYRAISARHRLHNENIFTAFNMLIKKNRTRYGGYIVHLGIIMMVAGFIGKAFDKEADLSMNLNDSINLKNYTLNYTKFWLETPQTNPDTRTNHFSKLMDKLARLYQQSRIDGEL